MNEKQRQDELITRIDKLEERIAALEKHNEEHPPTKKVSRLTVRNGQVVKEST